MELRLSTRSTTSSDARMGCRRQGSSFSLCCSRAKVCTTRNRSLVLRWPRLMRSWGRDSQDRDQGLSRLPPHVHPSKRAPKLSPMRSGEGNNTPPPAWKVRQDPPQDGKQQRPTCMRTDRHHLPARQAQSIINPSNSPKDFCSPCPRLRLFHPLLVIIADPAPHHETVISLRIFLVNGYGPLTMQGNSFQPPGCSSSTLVSAGMPAARRVTPSEFRENSLHRPLDEPIVVSLAQFAKAPVFC